MSDKHTFSLFVEDLNLDESFIEKNFHLNHSDLWRRLVKVLRINVRDEVILFDGVISCRGIILESTFHKKNSIHIKIIDVAKVTYLRPNIILGCPLLKRDSFEHVAYFASELGVTSLVPILTSKVQRKWQGEKELCRLKKIIIAAAEQSKNFAITEIREPINIELFLKKINKDSKKIHFDAFGRPFLSIVNEFSKVNEIVITLGPEGDLTRLEQDLLKKSGFNFVSLVPTVLKAEHAVAVGVGCIRSAMI